MLLLPPTTPPAPPPPPRSLLFSRPFLFLLLWYAFSALTLFLNKYLLSERGGDPTLLGTAQMLMTLTCGYIQMHFPLGMTTPHHHTHHTSSKQKPGFKKHMVLVGGLRFTTVLLGLLSLTSIPPSLTETIKSSAPLFTVLIARVLLSTPSTPLVLLSLIPVTAGLALVSFSEVDFQLAGFLAAMGANFTECLQNVYSKVLIGGGVSPAALQFYTSLASTLVQLPTAFFLVEGVEPGLFPLFLLNGLFFHFQSMSAYVLMDYISPVTHSVANTAKRALLILLSIHLYDDHLSLLSVLGLVVLFLGVVLYNEATKLQSPGEDKKMLV